MLSFQGADLNGSFESVEADGEHGSIKLSQVGVLNSSRNFAPIEQENGIYGKSAFSDFAPGHRGSSGNDNGKI